MKSGIVIGIDSSTTSTKAIAWDHSGMMIAEGNCPIKLSSPEPTYYEQDSDDWWNSTLQALRMVTHQIDNSQIAALAISNQRETFVGLERNGKPVRPAIIWLDERCKSQVEKVVSVIGENNIHEITGKPKDYAPVVYRLAWMKENENELFRKVNKFCDVQTFLVYKLTGHYRTSWPSADPMGMFDLKNKKWSETILDHLEIKSEQLPEVFQPGSVLGELTSDAAAATGLKAGTRVIAGGGDGQVAGLGVNALRPQRAYLNLGTAVVSGTYSTDYIANKSFRTMAACSEKGYYFETSLRSGTFLIDWFIKQLLRSDITTDPRIYLKLENEAKEIKPGSEGVMVLPYWNAVMNPYWDPEARGCITGLSSGHHRGHIYRAILEGIAMEQTLATQEVEKATGTFTEEYAIIGGGAKSDLWRQIIADASGKKILSMSSDEASSLGAGIAAAKGAGWFPTFQDAADSMVHVKSITNPVPENEAIYKDLLNKFKTIYPAIKGIK
jgi:sugar (pentulose or hexulose) kinase